MKLRPLLLLLLAFSAPLSRAQFGQFGDVPVEITADGESRFEGGMAVAENNVAITYGDTNIFCDYAQYNPETRDLLLAGHVRIYREGYVLTGERAVYNLETKKLRAADFSGASFPFLFNTETLSSFSGSAYRASGAFFTTHDSVRPDTRFRAKGVRIYPDDRVVFTNVTFQVGQVPVLWLPYLHQSLREDMAFTISPGYSNNWGAFLLSQYTFPIADNAIGRFHFDLRSTRGLGLGFDSDFKFGQDNRSFGRFRSYYTDDASPDENTTGLPREAVDSGRYRISFQSRIFFTEDVYANIDINKLSDSQLLDDFFRGEFTTDPQPDNFASLTKWDEDYTLTLIGRAQLNEFQDVTERLPELALDIKRQNFFRTPLFYEGETSIANLQQNFADGSTEPEYDTVRFDTLHQWLYPRTYFGWLAFTPRLGFRATYYSDSGSIEETTVADPNALPGEKSQEQIIRELVLAGSETRFSAIAGFEASFKVSKAFEQVQSRRWGLDGLRHILQPYTNFSLVSDSGTDAADILQFDTLRPSTQLPAIDFPQFVSIDAIDKWTVWRWGMRNRLQTRRDDDTFNWLTLDTYFDINIDNPYDDTDFSNVYNKLRFRPLPWATLNIDSQLPILDSGFSEVNTWVNFQVHENLDLLVGNRYLSDNQYFEDSNLLTFGAFLRLNENWAISLYEQYEIEDSTLEAQRYMLHRDLTSWVASLGAIVRDNRGEDEFGLLLTFTLKDFPQLNLPFNFDPQGQGGEN